MKIINLLPKNKQKELRYESLLHGMVVIIGISVASFLVVFFVQIGVKLYLASELSSVLKEVALLKTQVNKQDNAVLKQKIKAINDIVTDYNVLISKSPKWSKVIKAFATLPPEEIAISTFVVNSPTNSVTINGFSPTRELVIQLHDNIEADSNNFYNIDYPLENIAKEKDVSFHFNFNVKDELLK